MLPTTSRKLYLDPLLEVETDDSFKSWSAALTNARDGDEVILEEGEYQFKACSIPKSVTISGKSLNTKLFIPHLELNGNIFGTSSVTLKNLTIISNGTGITIQGGNHTIENCHITFQTPYGGRLLAHRPSNVKIIGNTFVHSNENTAPFKTDIPYGVTICAFGLSEIIGNTIIGTSLTQCAVQGGRATIRKNTIKGYTAGIHISQHTALIESNTVTECNRGMTFATTDQATVRNNFISDCIIGIDVNEKCNLEITGNTVTNTIGPALALKAAASAGSPVIRGNTFSKGKMFGVKCSTTKSRLEDAILRDNAIEGYTQPVVGSGPLDILYETALHLVDNNSVSIEEVAKGRLTASPESFTQTLDMFAHVFHKEGKTISWNKELANTCSAPVLKPDFAAPLSMSNAPQLTLPRPLPGGTSDQFTDKWRNPVKRTVIIDPKLDAESDTAYRSLGAALKNCKECDKFILAEEDIHEPEELIVLHPIQIYGKSHKSRLFVSKLTIATTDPSLCANIKDMTIIFEKDNGGMEISGTTVTLEDCRVIFQAKNTTIHNFKNSFFISDRNSFEFIGKTKCALNMEADSKFEDCIITGNGNLELFLLANSFFAVVNCSFKDVTFGIEAHMSGTITASFEKCKIAIIIDQNEIAQGITSVTKCYFNNCLVGVTLGQSVDFQGIQITKNKFTNTVGPSINARLVSGSYIVSQNKISNGKTVALWVSKKSRDQTSDNFVTHVPSTGPHMDAIIGCIMGLIHLHTTPVTLEKFLNNTYQIHVSTNLMEVLQNRPDIFKVTDSAISWSDDLYVFPQAQVSNENTLNLLEWIPEQPKASKKKKQKSSNNKKKGSQQNSTSGADITAQSKKAQKKAKKKNSKPAVQSDTPSEDTIAINNNSEPEPTTDEPEMEELSEEEPEQPVTSTSSTEAAVPADFDDSEWQQVGQKKQRPKKDMTEAPKPRNVPTQQITPKPSKSENATPTTKPKRKDYSKEARKIFDRTGGLCYLCRKPMIFENRHKGQEGAWHMDHVMPVSKYPELDIPENLLPAHVDCDSCKGAQHLQSLLNQQDFQLLTIPLTSLHPEVAKQIAAAKALFKNAKAEPPSLLNSKHFPQLSPAPKKASVAPPQPQKAKASDPPVQKPPQNNNNDEKYVLPERFVIPFSDIEMSTQILGSGGFGTVYRGKYKGTPVAVKRIHAENMSEQDRKLFQKEVSILGELRHPNVILMIGICVSPEACCIVTELFEKKSLQHVLDSAEPLTEKQKLGFALDIARGLSYLHGKKIIHRDLKPLNVMVDNSGVCKIADFGLSGVLSQTTNGSFFASNAGPMGSIVYMAPESLTENPKVEFASDVYSFGITLWQIYTRTPPYQKVLQTGLAGMVAIARDVPQNKLRPELPKDCWEDSKLLMTLCWANEPKDRPLFENIVQMLEKLL